MKSVLLLSSLSCIILFVLLCPVNARAQYENCWPECEVAATGGGSETFEVPGYTGCSVTYTYTWRRCTNGKVYFGERKFSWQYPVGDCDDYFNELYDGNDINTAFADWVFEIGLTKVQEKFFMNEYNNAAPWNKYLYECPNGLQHYYGVKASCGSYYLALVGPPTGQQNYEVGLLACDGTACCVKKTTICYNTSTQTTEITEQWDSLPEEDPSCASTSIPQGPQGTIAQTPCIVICSAE